MFRHTVLLISEQCCERGPIRPALPLASTAASQGGWAARSASEARDGRVRGHVPWRAAPRCAAPPGTRGARGHRFLGEGSHNADPRMYPRATRPDMLERSGSGAYTRGPGGRAAAASSRATSATRARAVGAAPGRLCVTAEDAERSRVRQTSIGVEAGGYARFRPIPATGAGGTGSQRPPGRPDRG